MNIEHMNNNVGKWNIVGRSGVIAIHAALLHTSEVLFYARPEEPSHKYGDLLNGLPGDEQRLPSDRDVTLSTLINLVGPDAFIPVAMPVEHNPFCSGLTFLPDGNLFVAGGDKKNSTSYDRAPFATKYDGRRSIRHFVPGKAVWEHKGEMQSSRWYPTCTTLPDGRIFIVSGCLTDMEVYNNQNPTCEIYPPASGGPQYLPLLAEAWPYDSYPFVFSLPDGSLFLFAKDREYQLKLKVDAFGRERWQVKTGAKLPSQNGVESPAKQYPNSATAVLLPLLPENGYAADILIIGGGGVNVHKHWETVPGSVPLMRTHDVEASGNCFKINAYPGQMLEWSVATSLNHPRVMADSVLLPDGKILVVNGVSKGFAGGYPAMGPAYAKDAVKVAELYDPINDVWEELAPATCNRLYHSTALLLPDGTVLVAGSDHQVNANGEVPEPKALAFEYRMEIFQPPYLFDMGGEIAQRPVILNAPSCLRYEQEFEVAFHGINNMPQTDLKAVLIKPGAVTHGNNMTQRLVGLTIVKKTASLLGLKAPPNENIAVPGYYMLFILHNGVPSVASFLQLQVAAGTQKASIDISGVVLWLKASEGVTADGEGRVSSWADCSGCGNDVYAKTTTGDQLYLLPQRISHELNGEPVIRFLLAARTNMNATYGACMQSRNPTFLSGGSPYQVFIVAHPWSQGFQLTGYPRPATWGDLIGWGDFSQSGLNTCVGLRLSSGAVVQPNSDLPKYPGTATIFNYWSDDWQYGDKDINDPKDPQVTLSAPMLLEMFYDGQNTGIKMNTTEIKSDPAPDGRRNTLDGPLTIGVNGGLALGYGGNGAFFRGDIAEIIVYERYLSAAERYLVQEYLREKYSLW
jgi:hypothetical protein